MELLTGLLTLPIAPVRGAVWLTEQIRDQAEQELYDPAAVRRQLAEVDQARAAGEISGEVAAEREDELLSRLPAGRSRGPEM